MTDRRQYVTRPHDAHTPSNEQLWTAPPRNHDWIAARIGRG